MNYRVIINGEPTKRLIVNSPSEEAAHKVWKQFNEEEIELVEANDITAPSMFNNCIIEG